MKITNKSANGTSFHKVTIKTTVNELVRVLGNPQGINNDGSDKVNFDWTCETRDGKVVTIYDWKEYRKLDLNEEIEFHLGGRDQYSTLEGKEELEILLNN